MAMVINSMISTHFKLREFVRTSVHGVDNTPSPEDLYRLTRLCCVILEPLRERFGPLWITSGYRSQELNRRIGGASTSAHLVGCAADLVPMTDGVTLESMMAWLAAGPLPFDQAIEEHGSTDDWLHVAIVRPGSVALPRRELLVMRDGAYSPWLHE